MAALLAYNPDRSRTSAAKQRLRVRDRLRRRIAAEIQRLVDILDELDGDADFEPSLGWLSSGGHSYRDGNADLEENVTTV